MIDVNIINAPKNAIPVVTHAEKKIVVNCTENAKGICGIYKITNPSKKIKTNCLYVNFVENLKNKKA